MYVLCLCWIWFEKGPTGNIYILSVSPFSNQIQHKHIYILYIRRVLKYAFAYDSFIILRWSNAADRLLKIQLLTGHLCFLLLFLLLVLHLFLFVLSCSVTVSPFTSLSVCSFLLCYCFPFYVSFCLFFFALLLFPLLRLFLFVLSYSVTVSPFSFMSLSVCSFLLCYCFPFYISFRLFLLALFPCLHPLSPPWHSKCQNGLLVSWVQRVCIMAVIITLLQAWWVWTSTCPATLASWTSGAAPRWRLLDWW